MGIVAVYNPHKALPEQKSLAGSVFLKALMLPRRDMVRLKIRKDTVIEYKSLSPVELQSLG